MIDTIYKEKFIDRSGKKIIFRYPTLDDLHSITDYANNLSKEDTFIVLSGEKITQEEERADLQKDLQLIKHNNLVYIGVFSDEICVGLGSVTRITKSRTRSLHVGVLRMSIQKEYRGLGLGTKLLTTLIQLSRGNFRLLILSLFGNNVVANKIYEKAGFKEAGAIPDMIWYKGNYTDKVFMYLPLK